MSDIELVIKMPEAEYNIAKYGQYGNINVDVVRKAIADGTPLPKHHGRLIEVNELLEHELFTFTRYTGIDEAPCEDASMIIDNAPIIIEGSDSE